MDDLEDLAHRAVELLENGLSIYEITQKMRLKRKTVEWLLASQYAQSGVSTGALAEYRRGEATERALGEAKRHEKLLEYEEAAKIYKQYGLDDDVIRVREEAINKAEQTVVHGDYVDDRDTIVKDSVLNRTNVGASSDDKFTRLEKLTEMKKEGFIDDDEFKQMKKEILGK